MNIDLDKQQKPLLKVKGSYWRDLQQWQKKEILTQFKGMQADPMIYEYRFFYSTIFKHWIITNAMATPMRKLNVFKGVSNG